MSCYISATQRCGLVCGSVLLRQLLVRLKLSWGLPALRKMDLLHVAHDLNRQPYHEAFGVPPWWQGACEWIEGMMVYLGFFASSLSADLVPIEGSLH